MKPKSHSENTPNLSSTALAFKSEAASNRLIKIKEMTVDGCTVEVRQGSNSVWVFVTGRHGGGFALRAVWAPGEELSIKLIDGQNRHICLQVDGSLGQWDMKLITPSSEEPSIRCIVNLTPRENITGLDIPRDLYPIDRTGDPSNTTGEVKAAQRGYNAGVVYFALNEPQFGSVLYFQNFTSLTDYFNSTQTAPDGAVGGDWPEMGFLLPKSSTHPLEAGKTVTISDSIVAWNSTIAQTPQESARVFLDLLSGVYRRLELRPTEYHDWPALAGKTLHDLQTSPKATISAYGHKYLHPYTSAEYPDSMVQLTVLMALREYSLRDKRAGIFSNELLGGVKKFFDSKLGVIRRYLPNIGGDKNSNEVDSWYLYHPTANLGRLAHDGDQDAAAIFLQSADFGMKVARHFKYRWPVQFDIETLAVIKEDRKPGDPGQSDVGGLFAYVMVQAYRLTGKRVYLSEAKRAIDGLSSLGFELEYQANITGWAANACLQLYLITEECQFLEQSYVFLANFFHNSVIWESEIAFARNYRNFLAPTCLHDGPYVAIYECYEAFAAFHEYLTWGKSDLPVSVRLLLSEYCKYCLTRAWYYYPAHLPAEILAADVRNGEIDRLLAFPLEDLYADGQPAGQVGQEIYGCGAAFALVTRAYHELNNTPFTLYCDYPIFDLQQSNEPCLAFRVRGVEGFYCEVRLIPITKTGELAVIARDGDRAKLHVSRTVEGHYVFRAPASRGVEIEWSVKA